MARQPKVGLDYFELDCLINEKVKLIRAEYGLKGFAVVVMMYQHIYGGDHGYYCEWDEERLLLFMSDNGLIGESKNLIDEVIQACIRRNIFSERLYKEYGILTSSGVQKQYLKATAKRKVVNLKKEYLLVSVGEDNKNVVINSINVDRNQDNVDRNIQRREEKSREENTNTLCKADALALFEQLWKMYPVKKGKGQVSLTAKMRLLKVGYEEMARAIDRYKTELEKEAWRSPQNGSTFFNSGYVDYLDENYVPTDRKSAKGKNQFHNFPQRERSGAEMSDLEKQLLR